jgi:hypothetical protein
MRKILAAVILSTWDFTKKHRFIAFFLGLLLAAAAAGGLYLIVLQFPTVLSLPCFTGGCQ